MVTVHNIEPNPPAQPSNKGGRPARAGSGATVQPAEASGRALATQRDALFFRSEAILRLGAPDHERDRTQGLRALRGDHH